MNAIDLAKMFAFRYTKFAGPTFQYMIEPIGLSTIVQEIERMKGVSGSIVEIGVARGMTTRFICEHLVLSQQTNQRLYAIDTFNSFLPGDLDYEVEHRGKKRREIASAFGYNDFDVWKRNFRAYPFVEAVQSDCGAFDYSSIAPIKVALLDVDLYLPTKRTLPKLYESLIEGGVILVDDVTTKPESNSGLWDGADQAYMEFCEELKISPVLLGSKCGVIRK